MPVNSFRQLKHIFKHMGSKKVPFCVGLAGDSLVRALQYIVQAFVIRDMVNAVASNRIYLLKRGLAAYAVLMVCISILGPFFGNILAGVTRKTGADIRVGLIKHILKLPYSYFAKNHSGDLISRANSDVDAIESLIYGQLYQLVFSVVCIHH